MKMNEIRDAVYSDNAKLIGTAECLIISGGLASLVFVCLLVLVLLPNYFTDFSEHNNYLLILTIISICLSVFGTCSVWVSTVKRLKTLSNTESMGGIGQNSLLECGRQFGDGLYYQHRYWRVYAPHNNGVGIITKDSVEIEYEYYLECQKNVMDYKHYITYKLTEEQYNFLFNLKQREAMICVKGLEAELVADNIVAVGCD